MSKHLYIDADDAKLKTYSVSSRGGKAVVKLELEVSDPHALGYLVQKLADFKPEPPPKKSARAPQRLLPPPEDFDQ